MAFYHRNSERKRIPHDYRRQEEEVVGSLCRLGSRPISPKSLLEQEKRIRREIANSNERRRMQSINAGFQSLRSLLPNREGEKLSKAAILQSTADYVFQLQREKTRLLEQNNQLSRRILNNNNDSDGSCSDSPLPKRKKREPADTVDEGIGNLSPPRMESSVEDIKRELLEVRDALERERSLRLLLEEQIKNLETRLFQLDNGADGVEPMHLEYHSEAEENIKSSRSIILSTESGLGSPQSPISSQDMESNNEMSPRESSPDLSCTEIPEDLSGKTSAMILSCVDELSISDVANIPGLLSSSPPHSISSPFPSDITVASEQETYKVGSRSRQNLETIVEAIKHVEGIDVFHGGDSKPVESELPAIKKEEDSFSEEQFEEQIQETIHSLTNGEFSFQDQIIRNAPLTQSRPGVIVSNLS